MIPQSPLGRPLDFRYRSNILVVAGAAVVALAFAVYNQLAADPLASPWWAAGGAAFLAWAVAREIDPDHSSSAAVALVLGALAAAAVSPSLLVGFGVLIATRLITGTVGLDMSRFDLLAVIAIGALLGGSAVSIASVPALLVGIVIAGGWVRRAWGAAAAAAGVSVLSLVLFAPSPDWGAPGGWAVLFGIGTALAAVLIIPAATPHAVTDAGSKRIDRNRLTASRLATVGTVLIAAILGGSGGIAQTAPIVVAAVAGVALVRMWRFERSTVRADVG